MKNTLLAKEFLSIEAYAAEREAMQAEAVAHRSDRTVRVGPNVKLVFEDELTVRYDIQERLRAEGISDDEAVQAEIDAYSTRIPDGGNLKATLTLVFKDESKRRARMPLLVGMGQRGWTRVDKSAQIFATSTECAPEGGSEDGAPAAHSLRFELEKSMVRDLKQGSPLTIGIDHPEYSATLVLNDNVRRALLKDFG